MEIFRDAIITYNHDFSKIPRKDLEVLADLFPNLKKLNNDYLSEEEEDPKVQVTTSSGIIEVLGFILFENWKKAWVVCKTNSDLEVSDNKLKKWKWKNMPKVKLPLLEGKRKYLQFGLALQEQTKDFTNSEGHIEGDKK